MNQEKARATARKTGDWSLNEIEAIDQFIGALYQERECLVITHGELKLMLKKAKKGAVRGSKGYCACGAYKVLEGAGGLGLYQIARIAEEVRIFVQMPMRYCPACGKQVKTHEEEEKNG